MKVRSWDGSEEDLPIAHAIYKEVDWADDRDAVEDLRKKLYVLLRIVSELVEHLGEPAAKAVLSEVGWYCRPVEERQQHTYGCNFTSDAGPVFMVQK